jgi:ABC-type transport system involved in multi-copper enzyme maturation permease subunit
MLSVLVARSLGRARGLIIGLGALLCTFQVLLVVVAREISPERMFTQLTALIPAAVQQMAGGLVFSSFGGLALFGFFHPVVVIVFVEAAIFLAVEPAWEVEAGIVDLTLARPVPRWMMLTRTIIVVFGSTAAFAALMAIASRVALHALAPPGAAWPRLASTALLALNLTTLAWCFAAFGLLIATSVRRRSAALGIAGVAAVGLDLLNVLAELWRPMYSLRHVSPFHYYNAPALLALSGSSWRRDVLVLLVVTIALCVSALLNYQRRDL